MPITPTNPFKGRQFPGEVIILCVRWYLRYPLAYEHVAELLAERGVEVDPSCIWRWVQSYAPELNKRCRRELRPTNRSWRVDETYVRVKGKWAYLYRASIPPVPPLIFCCPLTVTPQQRSASSRAPCVRPPTRVPGSSM